MFLWKTNVMQLVINFFVYHQRRQNPKWPLIMVKKSFSVLGKQQDTQIMKLNSHPYTLNLQYPYYSKFSQLSYESGCSHAFWCRGCAAWH